MTTTTTIGRPSGSTARTEHRWLALLVIAGAQLMGALDATMLTGLAGFAASSALAGASGSLGMLLTGRALRGGFAALMAPAALSPLAVPLGAGVGLLVGFLARQASSGSPLLPLGVLLHRTRSAAYLSVAFAVVGSFGLFLMLTYHFQVVLGWTPLQAGLAFVPMTVAVSASSYGLASRLLHRVQPGTLVVPGLLTAAAGLALLARLEPTSGYPTLILPAELLVGAGMGCVFTPSFHAATRDIEPRLIGVASAVVNTATQIGGTVGTAVLNTVAISATAGYAARAHSAGDALVHGYAVATAAAAVALVVAAGIAAVLFFDHNSEGTS